MKNDQIHIGDRKRKSVSINSSFLNQKKMDIHKNIVNPQKLPETNLW